MENPCITHLIHIRTSIHVNDHGNWTNRNTFWKIFNTGTMPFTCRNHACITGVFPYTCDSHVKRMITCVYHAYHTFCKIFNTGTMPFVCRNHACITGVFPYTCDSHVKRMITCVYHAYHIRFSHMCHMRGMKRLFHMRATHMWNACVTHVHMCGIFTSVGLWHVQGVSHIHDTHLTD